MKAESFIKQLWLWRRKTTKKSRRFRIKHMKLYYLITLKNNMKKLFTIALLGLSISAVAQTGSIKNASKKAATVKPAVKDTAKYVRFVKVPENFYSGLTLFTQAYKDNVIYNPIMAPEIKNQEQININQFLNNLSKVALLDSAKIK